MAEETEDGNQMITELYNQLYRASRPESKSRKVSVRQYLIMCCTKEEIYRDMTPSYLPRVILDDVAKPRAQITYKLLMQKDIINSAYESMADFNLKHPKSL